MIEPTKVTEEFYVLIEKSTGKPVHVRATHNGDARHACGESTHQLTLDENEPLYKAETLLQAWLTMKADIKWYNSSEDRPCWGDELNAETLQIVKHVVTVETSVDMGPFKLPLMADKAGRLDTRDVAAIVARRVFHMPDLDSERSYTIVLYNTKAEGATPRSAFDEAVGQLVYFDQYSSRRLYAVTDAREEYQDPSFDRHGDLEMLCGLIGAE